MDAVPTRPDAAAADGAPDAGVCVDDRYGPGRPDLPAARLPLGEQVLILCPGTEDWFTVDAAPGAYLRVAVDGPASLTLLVHDAEGRALTAGGLEATVRVPLGGVAVGVAGGGAAPVSYRLTLAAQAGPGACAPDDAEPDDDPERATPLDPGPHGALTACPGDEDWFTVPAGLGEGVTVTLETLAGGPLRLALYAPVGERWVRADQVEVEAEREGSVAAVAAERGFRVAVSGATSTTEGRYALRVARADAPAGVRTARAIGTARILDRPVTAEGLGDPVPLPAAGLRVDVVDAAGRLVGLSVADADGRFDVPFAAADVDYDLRLVAEAVDAVAPVSVGPPTGSGAPWAVVVAHGGADAFVGGPVSPAADDPATPALLVARTFAAGLDRVAVLLPARRAPPLDVRWSEGMAADCGTCFEPSTGVIELSGLLRDPDEWDDAVMLHELGHYVLATFSRDDSGGGRHDGSPLPPPLAWSEGFATFHASWQLEDPVQLDLRATGVARLDLEAMDDPRAVGTADGTQAGDVSERLVAGVLWDLDGGASGVADLPGLPDAVLWRPLFDYLPNPRADRGATGVDLVDYLDGLQCDEPDHDWLPLALDRGFPYDGAGPCGHRKAAPPFAARREGDDLLVQVRADGRLSSWRGTWRREMPVKAGEVVRWRPPADGAAFVGVGLDAPGRHDVDAVAWAPLPPPKVVGVKRAGAYEARP